MSGAPTAAQLQQVIERPLAAAGSDGGAWLDSTGRGGRGRIAPAERGLRAVHQAMLRSFTQTGTAPHVADLAQRAAPYELPQVLAELADGDFLGLDDTGRITAAYPFSALPTRHRVQIPGNAAVYAMCAIDALGISAMTGHPVVIESADPATAVVYAGRTRGRCAGPSATVCCGSMNFHTTQATAAAWAAAHPEITGGDQDQDQAPHTGISIFGQLLS